MPFSQYDPRGEALKEYKRKNVSVIVLLASDDECREKAGRNLRTLYEEEGFKVIYLPIPDFGVPSPDALLRAIEATISLAETGRNVVVHCSAGIGRTGLFLAMLAKRDLNLSGEDAISLVRQYIHGAVETAEQEQLVLQQKDRISAARS